MQPRETTADPSYLIQRARRGDEAAFGELVDLYRQRIIGYCHRMAAGQGAEDLAQDIFVKLYLSLDRFDTSKPLAPFLFRIAHNHCLDALKKRTVQTVPLLREDEKEEIPHLDGKPNPEELIQKAEVQKAVHAALAAMPALYRSPIIMRHVEGLSYEEISEALNLPLGTVKARIHRGRELLQQKLRSFVFYNGDCK